MFSKSFISLLVEECECFCTHETVLIWNNSPWHQVRWAYVKGVGLLARKTILQAACNTCASLSKRRVLVHTQHCSLFCCRNEVSLHLLVRATHTTPIRQQTTTRGVSVWGGVYLVGNTSAIALEMNRWRCNKYFNYKYICTHVLI